MSAKQPIVIKGAKTHNLKNIDVSIPRNGLVVVTGVSGSGKSSLVFDTLYAEGHRRYVESLSSYARQFVARMQKPPVDYITGISPAIAIEQRVHSSNARSTVGSITEIYDYLRLLFARIGRTFSPKSGEEVKCQSVTDVVDFICAQKPGTKVFLCTTVFNHNRSPEKELEVVIQMGFSRLWVNGETKDIQDFLDNPKELKRLNWEKVYLLIDRFIREEDTGEEEENFEHRIADSVQTAFNEGNGKCFLIIDDREPITFSEAFERDGIRFEKPTEQLFNFNNAVGACPECEGTGRIMGYDEDLIIPNKTYSVRDKAVKLWNHTGFANYYTNFQKKAEIFGFDIDKPYYALSKDHVRLLWYGNEEVHGIWNTIRALEKDPYGRSGPEINRSILARYKGHSTCFHCEGSRLRKEALYVKVNGFTIADFLSMSIEELTDVFTKLTFDETETRIAERIILEISNRLNFLMRVGLGYLNLSRKAATLSGGETQRINLATSLGSNLTGSLYILDEPSIGLHPRDTERLIGILESLRNLGNTVIVVEHDESVMRRANYLIDVGPRAGSAGGEIIFSGDYQAIIRDERSLTGKYLSGKEQVPLPQKLNVPKGYVTVYEAAENNLKGIDVQFPLGVMTAVTGVSGSGKTTLVKSVLYPILRNHLGLSNEKPGLHKDYRLDRVYPVGGVEMVDQASVATGARSTPISYIGAYDAIRNELAGLPESKAAYFQAGYFSYNVPGGRCEACQGEGVNRIQMQFMPDIELVCETCQGKRFREAILDIKLRNKNIYEILEMTVDEAIDFFRNSKKIVERLQALGDVGLGYIRLGQSTGTLSGGEAQRLKLAYFLHETDKKNVVYIFDEPTTGLHAHDVRKLIDIFRRMVDKGHTVIVIEHNTDVIKCADHVIDLGPEGGTGGGHLVFAGTPAELAKKSDSYTGQFLKEKFE